MIIFLDTETTDKELDSRLVQLAYKIRDTKEVVNELFRPPVDISFGAMAIHHITSEMVEGKPVFNESKHKDELVKILQEGILVAHNALFDINILNNEGVEVPQYIDTYRVSQHLIESERYALQYLRYFLKLEVETSRMAHDALGDVEVLEKLFEHLVELVKEKYSTKDDQEIFDRMIELTQTPVLLKKLMFGKYFGREFEDIASVDKGYLEWLYKTEMEKDEYNQNEDMLFTLEKYLDINLGELPF